MPNNGTLGQIWKAIRQLNPASITRESERKFNLALIGNTEEEISKMRSILLGPNFSAQDAEYAAQVIFAYRQPLDESQLRAIGGAGLILAAPDADAGISLPEKLVIFDLADPAQTFASILSRPKGTELRLALAKRFPALRQEVSRRVIRDISRENATFVILTALGDVVPSIFQPILGITEAAGDTVFLTANQVRMLFAIGAAYSERVGYTAQWKEISSIIGASFGWRSLARNLVSKIPFGGGLAPKGAIAYAGTFAVGEGARFFYATGQRMTREEVGQLFKRMYDEAIAFATAMVGKLRPGSRTE